MVLGRMTRRRGTETTARAWLELASVGVGPRKEKRERKGMTGGPGLSGRGRERAVACWAGLAGTGPRGGAPWAGAQREKREERGGWAGGGLGAKREREGKKKFFLGCLEFEKFWRDANGFEFKL